MYQSVFAPPYTGYLLRSTVFSRPPSHPACVRPRGDTSSVPRGGPYAPTSRGSTDFARGGPSPLLLVHAWLRVGGPSPLLLAPITGTCESGDRFTSRVLLGTW